MKSVAIIGLGWLGLPLAKHLQASNWQVIGTKRNDVDVKTMHHQGISAVKLILTPDLKGEPVDLAQLFNVHHLVINVPPSKAFTDLGDYTQAVKNIVNTAIKHTVKHIVFIGSTSIYPNKAGIFNENCTLDPDNEVGIALKDLQKWLFTLDVPIACDVLHLAGLIGEQRHPVKFLAGRAGLAQGNQPVNLIHQYDCLRAIELLLNHVSGKRVYNLVATQHPPKGDYYVTMAKLLGFEPPDYLYSDNDIQRIIQGNKIVQELGFSYYYADPYQMKIEIDTKK